MEEQTPEKLDYEKLGLKAGLEIHQQLDTHKLYCNCPSLLRKENPNFEIKRKLHAVAGEGGEIDTAAKHQAETDQTFIYQGYDKTTCLIELDEQPPNQINQEALNIALQISHLLNCKIVPITQIMRKTVIDGSNTSGFQRTVLIARDGYIQTNQGKIGIWYVYLEEDAARKIKKENNQITYRLDRLGIPLVEIVTAPDIKTPQQAKNTALKIGEILRATKVKRGIGTIRQDINISIKGHPRAEIKGFQDPKTFEKVVETEVERQIQDLKNKKELKEEVRGANLDGSTKYLRPLPSSARMYPETDLPLLKITKQQLDSMKKNLPKLKTQIKQELIKQGMSQELTKLLLQKNKLQEYKELTLIIKNPNLIAKMLVLWREEIRKHKNWTPEQTEETLNTDLLGDILKALKDKKIKEHDVKTTMKQITEGKNLKEALKKEEAGDQIEEEIINLIKEKPGLREGAYMGLLMAKYKGKISGQTLMELIKKHMN